MSRESLPAAQLSDALRKSQEDLKRAEEALRTSEARWRELNENLEQLVTERTGELRASESRFRTLAEVSPVGIYRADASGQAVYLNAQSCEIIGLLPESAKGYGWSSTVHPDDRERVFEGWKQAVAAKRGFVSEHRFQHADGRLVWAANWSQPEQDSAGEIVGHVGVLIDITVRKQAEAALRERTERYELVIAGAQAAIWDWDVLNQRVMYSLQWKALRGYADEEVSDRLEEWSSRIHPEDAPRVMAAVQAHFEGQTAVFAEELRVRCKDGSWKWITDRGLALRNAAGRVVRMAGSENDITARKQAEQELAQQRNELAHLSRVTMLGELSGSLAHELNQPLTAILSNAQAAQRFLARDDADLNEVRAILADIVAEDKRAGEIIHRLRLLLKKGEVQRQSLDLNEVVLEVLKLVRSDLVNHGISAQTQLAPALPAIKGDRVQLQQVLLNAVMNACQAMARVAPADRTLVVRTVASDGDGVQVEIADRGCGIPPENLERVFEPFFTTRTEGLGLGLAVCRTIIDAHGGKIWATNNAERGATFYFKLPTAPESES